MHRDITLGIVHMQHGTHRRARVGGAACSLTKGLLDKRSKASDTGMFHTCDSNEIELCGSVTGTFAWYFL